MPLPDPASLPHDDHVIAVIAMSTLAHPMSMTVGLICCVDLTPHGRTVGEVADCPVCGIAVVTVLRGAVGVVDAATTTLLAGGNGELMANPIT
jgi:hypothetical protein